jgi:hypothetical protein
MVDADLVGDHLTSGFDQRSSLGGGRGPGGRLLPERPRRFSVVGDLPPPTRPLIEKALSLGLLAFESCDGRGQSADLTLAIGDSGGESQASLVEAAQFGFEIGGGPVRPSQSFGGSG